MVRLDIVLGNILRKIETQECVKERERNYNLIIHLNNKTKD